MTPIVNRQLPPDAPAAAPTSKIENKRPTIIFRSTKKPQVTMAANDLREEFLKELKKPAQEYFSKVGLAMSVPDGFAFAEELDGPVQVLIGASEPSKMDFYFFSAKGKYPVDKAVAYLKSYFSDEMKVSTKGTPSSFYSRGGFKDMVQIKGGSSRGEYSAFFFSNPKSGNSHMLMILNRNINKSPARIRELVDSIRRSGS